MPNVLFLFSSSNGSLILLQPHCNTASTAHLSSYMFL